MFAPKQAGTPATMAARGDAPGRSVLSTGERMAADRASPDRARNGGVPLDPGTRSRLEPRFGFDFSAIRIHADAEAGRAAEAAGALAFTVGQHIVFSEGRYEPASRSGLGLLAHELAHAVQQGRSGLDEAASWSGLRSSTAVEERQAAHGAQLALAGMPAGIRPGHERSLARADKLHDDEQFGDAILSFRKWNTGLTADQKTKIRDAVVKATSKTTSFELAYAFFDYYSGWSGQRITVMSLEQETKAREQKRVAETTPGSGTQIRSDILDLPAETLGPLLLHELSHTGQDTNFMGSTDYQEGHSYGIEFFYAEATGDVARTAEIYRLIDAGAITVPSQRSALRGLFNTAYAVMRVLRKIIKTDHAPELAVTLTADEAQVLQAEYVTNFAHPSEALKKVIDDVAKHPADFAQPKPPAPDTAP